MIRTPTCRGCEHFACRHGHGTPWLARRRRTRTARSWPPNVACDNAHSPRQLLTEQITHRSSGRHFVTEPDGKPRGSHKGVNMSITPLNTRHSPHRSAVRRDDVT